MGESTVDLGHGRLQDAIVKVDNQLRTGNPGDLLLNLEKGELLRIAGQYGDSMSAFETADTSVKQWEETARGTLSEVASQVGATILGDGNRTYEAQDYEKVMLTTVMALNRLSQGDLENARVDIKRTHEREALIAEYRARQTEAAEEKAKEEGAQTKQQDLKGYPIETLNDPEVLALKNGYQNALSHYLSGFVYEVLNEPSLAAPGYRQAIELRPDSPVLEQGLSGLSERGAQQRGNGQTDVLFVIEAGNAPARESRKFMFPVPTGSGIAMVGMSYPVISPIAEVESMSKISVGETTLPVSLVADFNVMARRALKDDLPGMQTRAAVRMVAKAAAQVVAQKEGGLIAGLIANVAAVVAEPPADDRLWRTLPGRVYVARGFMPAGDYALTLPGVAQAPQKISVSGRHMIVPLRMYPAVTYLGEAGRFGELAKQAVVDEPAPKKRGAKRAAPPKAPEKSALLQ
ncbi:COG3014 family protein [Bordetella genomosp. 1]|uniref:COG3014 family protein n=1 Tax=Bordetella genomosp. 1 TaxID=1395607 RepID=UPI001140EB8E|nr:hypothetical protein [Bordetella genomosp. 1]